MDEKLILVVDDSQFLCAMLKKSLDSVGYNTLIAYTMAGGMQLLESSHPDLVLLDINLPDTPGPDACTIIKANPKYASTSIILMSGSYEEYIKQKVVECGANGYIKKPFSPSSILRWVKENSHILFPFTDFDDTSETRPYTIEDMKRIAVPPPPPPRRRPAAPAPAVSIGTTPNTPQSSEAGTFQGDGKTIVITDDSTFLCAILKDTLEKVGFCVHTFSNIRDTGYFLKSNDADLLFLDINLPDIAGDRACAIIKDSPRTRTLPIILISSAKEEQLRRLVQQSGADGFIIKPFTPLNVLDWIKTNAPVIFSKVGAALPPPEAVPVMAATKATEYQPALDNTPAPGQMASNDDGPTEGEIDILLRQLSSPLKEVRLDACYTLGEFRIQRAAQPLITMLSDPGEEIRGEAAWALGEIGNDGAVQGIINLLDSENPWLRDRAVEALGKLGDERAVSGIVTMLATPKRQLRITVIKALAGIPCIQSKAVLQQLLQDPDEQIVANAKWAFHQMETIS